MEAIRKQLESLPAMTSLTSLTSLDKLSSLSSLQLGTISLCVASAGYVVIKGIFNSQKRNKVIYPPGPPKTFLIGNIRDMPESEWYEKFCEWQAQYGMHMMFLFLDLIFSIIYHLPQFIRFFFSFFFSDSDLNGSSFGLFNCHALSFSLLYLPYLFYTLHLVLKT
jgi:hypothetical protein